MSDDPTAAGSPGPRKSRNRLRAVAKPRVTILTFVTLALLGLFCLTTMGMVLYQAEAFDAKLDDWIGIGALLVLIAMPYLSFAPVLIWLPRTLGESVVGLLAVLLIGGVGVALHVDVFFLSDNPLDLFLVAAVPWWQLFGIGIITVAMGLARIGHWLLARRGNEPRV